MVIIYIIHRKHRKDINAYEYNDDSVTVITDDRLRVRQSPQVYLPNVEKDGAIHLFDEIFSNAVDEITSVDTIGNEIYITYDETTKVVSIQDTGRGFPFGKLNEMCTVLSSSAKMGESNRAYSTSGGVHGMGLKLTTFLSRYLIVKTERGGKYMKISYDDGLQIDVKTGKSKDHGSYIEWGYDKRFFKDINITCEELVELITRKSYVIKNANILFNGIDSKKKPIIREFKNTGFKDYMKKFNIQSPMINGTMSFGDNKVEFTFGYDLDLIDSYNILSYTNNIYTKSGGSHVDGALEAIAYVIRKYMYDSYLSERDKKLLKVKSEDCRIGLTGIISVYTLNPKFKSQFKEALDDTNIKNFVFRSIKHSLGKFDNTSLNRICAIIKANVKARMASEVTRKKVRRDDITNIFSDDRIDSYVPVSKYSTNSFHEIMIVEGLSAGGGMKSIIDRNSQAILAIRGKIENVFDLPPEEALKQSQFLSNLNKIFNCGIGKSFDINKFPFTRINIATDADTDGNEIACQISMIFVTFFPEVVISGRLYKMIPPLYEVRDKGTNIFVPSVKEFMVLTQKNFAKDHTISLNDIIMSEEQIVQFLIKHERYVEKLERLSNQYAISPILCEFLLAYNHIGFENDTVKKWNKILPKLFRFIKAEAGEKYITISGIINTEYNVFEYTPELEDDINSDVIEPLSNIEHYYGYKLNKSIDMSLYEILKEFIKFMPKIISRFKGLGEMNPEDMERTMIKRDIRNSTRLTMNDIDKAFHRISVMHSKKKEFSVARKKYMENFLFNLLDIDT